MKDNTQMTETEKIIALIKLETDIDAKSGIAVSYLTAIEKRRVKCRGQDKKTLGSFALGELNGLIEDIRNAKSYKEKMSLFRYEDTVIGFLIYCFKTPANIPEENQTALRELSLLVENERRLENSITELFDKEEITSEGILDILETVTGIEDEFHRGALYAGLLHFSSRLSEIGDHPKSLISRFLEAELDRYLAKKDHLDEDEACNAEYIADLASFFLTERLTDQLTELLEIDSKEIRLFAIRTLAQTERNIPESIIEELAKDVSCAVVLYVTLKKADKLNLIPTEYADEEYIARSDMTRWLEYPSGLGETPSAIEYLGTVTVKKYPFRIFRFKSDSESLSEDKRGKWLIGWSSIEIGTFSPFLEYEKYEKKTIEKTLAHIAKKLIR